MVFLHYTSGSVNPFPWGDENNESYKSHADAKWSLPITWSFYQEEAPVAVKAAFMQWDDWRDAIWHEGETGKQDLGYGDKLGLWHLYGA